MGDRKYRHQGYQDGARTGGSGADSAGSSSERPGRLEGSPRGRGAERNREEVFRCKVCGEKNDPEVAAAAACRKCGAALHACNQCRHFDGAARWQCRQPIPAPIPAKSKANDCAFYAPVVSLDLTGAKAAETPDQARSAFDRLFGKR
ncbi:MAG TPA: hypothetical protein VMN04_15020 [Thermoanaerobaculia bacterium]|nr:hypothetical protein [Thermoanaerobaculia bacterium]